MSYQGAEPTPVFAGGTGNTSNTAYAVLCGGTSSTSPLQSIASVGTSGQVLTSNGAGALPTFQTPAATSISLTGNTGGTLTGSSFTFTGGTTGLSFGGAGTVMTLSGTLGVANGGTNATSFTQSNGIVTYNGTRLVNYAGPQINSSGYATNTSQPAFSFYNLNNVSNVTGDGTAYIVNFDTQIFQNGSNFASNTFTAPVAGNYLFCGSISSYNYGASHTQIQIVMLTTGANYLCFEGNSATMRELQSGNNIVTVPFCVIASMASSDTAKIQLTVTGSTKTINLLGSKAFTFFTGNLLC